MKTMIVTCSECQFFLQVVEQSPALDHARTSDELFRHAFATGHNRFSAEVVA